MTSFRFVFNISSPITLCTPTAFLLMLLSKVTAVKFVKLSLRSTGAP